VPNPEREGLLQTWRVNKESEEFERKTVEFEALVCGPGNKVRRETSGDESGAYMRRFAA